ncbi:MAG: lipoate--protein ligase family protein [Oligoflexia bacterium]|nr:lipoate--protein ligase family protein [Oligoflexia bacterium]
MIINSTNTCPFYNLGLEEALLRDSSDDHFMLWQSTPAVIYGKFQNPWREIHVDHTLDNDHLLVRRITGGGCVYQGPGNLNFSFIGSGNFESREVNLKFIADSLATIGVELKLNHRFDLIMDEGEKSYKVSGNAFKNTRGRWIQHGTLLISAEIENIWDFLTQNSGNIKSKSIESTRSPVKNISEKYQDIDMVMISQCLLQQAQKSKKFGELSSLESDEISTLDNLKYENVIKSKEWILGETPEFLVETNLSHSLGGNPIIIHVKKGRFENFEVLGNDLAKQALDKNFLGKYYTQQWPCELEKLL